MTANSVQKIKSLGNVPWRKSPGGTTSPKTRDERRPIPTLDHTNSLYKAFI